VRVTLMVPLAIAAVLYTMVSLAVRHPSPTPLDFRDVTAPAYLLLRVAVAVLVLAILAPPSTLNATALAWGYAAGLTFVGVPHLVGISRRECIQQFEIKDLYPVWTIVPRELLLWGVTFPAITACEEVAFRGVVHLPEPVVAAAQWLVYLAGSRTGVSAPLISASSSRPCTSGAAHSPPSSAPMRPSRRSPGGSAARASSAPSTRFWNRPNGRT